MHKFRRLKDYWFNVPLTFQQDKNITILREDLLDGGTKLRFLPHICPTETEEIVYASPFCGGAQVALATMGQHFEQKITIFTAQRKELHPMQRRAMEKGAVLVAVPYGYLSNVTAKAKAYAAEKGAFYLPFGFDVPDAQHAYLNFLDRVISALARPVDQVWIAAGSGMLARAYAAAFPDAEVVGVSVGKALAHPEAFGLLPHYPQPTFVTYPQPFHKACDFPVPFPSCANYDRKAWHHCKIFADRNPKKQILFINVLG